MKILMVSMNSIHFTRWTEQLRDSGHEIHWFNIRSGAIDKQLDFVTQHTGWRYRIKKGRGWIKKVPLLNQLNERDVKHVFTKALQDIKPDIVHSFALYVGCAPILDVMKERPELCWIYSSWGSDLFYYQRDQQYLKDIRNVLPRLNYMFADCKRDQKIADQLGFKGIHLGVFPGGGGFQLEQFKSHKTPFSKRKIIAVKGNQNRSGRAIAVLTALVALKEELQNYDVVVFGCENEQVKAFNHSAIPHIVINGRMSHKEVLTLFCNSYIYIGNSNSDGMPNTMLEAICAGAFPIQSDPGGATSEIIRNTFNGLLIDDPEDVFNITKQIKMALKNPTMIQDALIYNQNNIVPSLERSFIIEQVLSRYNLIEDSI